MTVMEYEGCYKFEPSAKDGVRPNKRRRTDKVGLHASWSLRRKTYEQLWDKQHARLNSILRDMNEATVNEVTTYIDSASLETRTRKLPSAILITGPSLASHGRLFDQLARTLTTSSRSVFVGLNSSHAPNLKTLLKHLIAKGTSAEAIFDEDDDDQTTTNRKGPRLLNYDLQILENAVSERSIERVVVAFQDCEAFDGPLLSDLIDLMSSWSDRIPFTLLFGVATSVENLEAKLTRRATRCVSGRRFDVIQAENALEQVFDALHSKENVLWLGGGTSATMLSRQRDHIQSLQAFADAAQYAYMTSFYANALSLFLSPSIKFSQVPTDHFEALRNLPSFVDHAQRLLENKKPALVRSLLESDRDLFEHVRDQLDSARTFLGALLTAIAVFHKLQDNFSSINHLKSDLYVQAFSNELRGSTLERTVFLSLRKANSETLSKTIRDIVRVLTPQDDVLEAIALCGADLQDLLSEQSNSTVPLRSEEDIQNSTLRTTVIAKKVELSKQKSALTKADTAYSDILSRFVDIMDKYLESTLINPKDLPLHEIFLYDLKSPHRDVFTPKPRFAVERAMSSPHDYLDCNCCAPSVNANANDELTLSATQPPTAILYQLYLESGAVVNAADLRAAFVAIMSEEIGDEVAVSALFQRSLAELRFLGLIKGTKKKVDHVLKVSWKGL